MNLLDLIKMGKEQGVEIKIEIRPLPNKPEFLEPLVTTDEYGRIHRIKKWENIQE